MTTSKRRVSLFERSLEQPVINDNAERNQGLEINHNDTICTTDSTVEQIENLQKYLKFFHDNKFCKDNAWSIDLINTFNSLISKHHQSVQNFLVAGSTLEASSRIYCLRVDSVHQDILRISSGLGNRNMQSSDRNADSLSNDENEIIQNCVENDRNNTSQPVVSKKNRKYLSMITKNKKTLNSKIDLVVFVDPIFTKLNLIFGSISNPTRLLQNILHSHDSELQLKSNILYWDGKPANELENLTEEDFDYTGMMLHEIKLNKEVQNSNLLRPIQSGYMITNKPLDCENNYSSSEEGYSDPGCLELSVAFDINADVELLPPEEENNLLNVDVSQSKCNDFTEEDHMAVAACRGLRRPNIIIEELGPIDSSTSALEYSYRPIEHINQFWAGPSHWQFKKKRNHNLNVTINHRAEHHSDNALPLNKVKRRKEKRNRLIFNVYDFGDLFLNLNDVKLKKINIFKKWKSKNLKLPTDLNLDRNRLEIFQSALGLSTINTNLTLNVSQISNEDMVRNSAYHSMEYDNQFSDGSNLNLNQDHNMNDVNKTVDFIDSHYDGAPDKIEKITIPFAKKAKVIDMKQLKECSWRIITSNSVISENSFGLENPKEKSMVLFSDIYKKLPNMLTPHMAQNLSLAISFYAILHLANEKNLNLMQNESLDNFQILRTTN